MSSFFKCSALASAGLSLGIPAQQVFEARASETLPKLAEVPTFCELCFWNCGLFAKGANGKVIKLDGNPLSERGRGRLCARGNGGLGLLYDPDRIKYPMINEGKRGEPKWKRASWDEALGFMAGKMARIKQEYGPEALALLLHGNGGSFWKNLVEAYGSPNHAEPSFANCRGPRDVGFVLTYGMDAGSPEYYDFQSSRYIVLLGHHLGENAHNSQVQDVVLGVANGAKLVVVDPRCSNIAAKANTWLPIRPATDMALLLAWIKVLVDEELYDKPYVETLATGFDDLKAALDEATPAWASQQTGIPEETIVRIAREMASHKPNVCVSAGRYGTWYGDDTQRARAIAILNALLGSWGRPGGYYLPAMGSLPKYPGVPAYPETEEKVKHYPFELLQATTSLKEATLSADPYPIKGWIAYGSNLIRTLPNPKETIEAIQKPEMFAVVDVLPSASRLGGLPRSLANGSASRLISHGRTLMATSRPAATWQASHLRSSRRRGSLSSRRITTPIPTFQPPPTLRTPSGKSEPVSSLMAEAGVDAVPRYTKHPEPPQGHFRLLFGRSPVHSFSRTVNNFILTDLVKAKKTKA